MPVFAGHLCDPESEKAMALWEPRAEDPSTISLEGVPPPTEQELGFFSWTFAELLRAGGPILPTITTLCGATENPWLRRLASQMWQDVCDGGELSAATQTEPFLSKLDSEFAIALEFGEENGDLADLLMDYAADALQGSTQSLSSVIERSVDLVQLTVHLADLLREGQPVVAALKTTVEQLTPETAGVVNKIAASVEAGDSLSVACTNHSCPALFFDPLWLFCVEWGEKGGALDRNIENLAMQAFSVDAQE